MGKRARRRAGDRPAGPGLAGPELSAPVAEYRDADGNLLELRGVLTLGARREYAATLHGGLNQEDAWQRAVELLFERVAVGWTVHGVRTDTQKAL
ncbi:MAG TPA: hypothetical protein VFN48_09270, partial [Solirubrobacteraceae bacterium]|nr:hypothetical protein [Solirubrobacteraceae bacterium]